MYKDAAIFVVVAFSAGLERLCAVRCGDCEIMQQLFEKTKHRCKHTLLQTFQSDSEGKKYPCAHRSKRV